MIYELRDKFSLKVLFKVSGISKQVYYYHLKQEDYITKNHDIIEKIKEIFENSHMTYGYRRVCAELSNQGLIVNHKKVNKIMRILGLKPKCEKVRKYSSYKGMVGKVADNLIKRNFNSDLPMKRLSTDVTEFKISSGKLYLSPIIDMYNREIVAYSLSQSPNNVMIYEMLDKLFENCPCLDGTILHSDQGWQYQNPQYQRKLKEHGIIQSMSRKGNCNDNGIIESFFGVLKTEMFNSNKNNFNSIDELSSAIDDYINFYNNVRIKARLNYMSPVDYKKQMMQVI